MKTVQEKIADLKAKHPEGHCLHVQICDGNLEDNFFDEESLKDICDECKDISEDLKKIPEKTRFDLYFSHWKPLCECICGAMLSVEQKEKASKRLSEEFVLLPIRDYGPKEHVTKILSVYAMEHKTKGRST